mgnify:CR=1 FL=1
MLTAKNLWVSKLTLSGLAIDATDDFALLKINQTLDMSSGRIEAMFVSVGFAGSMTSRLVVHDMVADSNNPDFYWDMGSGDAHFSDATFIELNRMANLAVYLYGDTSTITTQIFGAVSANKNATVSDYMNAINEISSQVQEKYRMLKL